MVSHWQPQPADAQAGEKPLRAGILKADSGTKSTAAAAAGGSLSSREQKQQRDHARENRRIVGQDSEINRMKKAEQAIMQSAPSEPKREKFPHIQSSVAANMRRGSEGRMVQGRADEEELSSGFNRGVNLEVDVEAQKPKRTSSVGSGLKRGGASEAGDRNYIRENFEQAPAMHKPPPKKKEDPHVGKHKPGAVPTYLKQRKQELEDDRERQRLASLPPDAPPGLRLLPEQERLETLAALREKKADLDRTYMAIPITSTTLATQSRRKELDAQLKQVEGAIELFSKPKVFVAIE